MREETLDLVRGREKPDRGPEVKEREEGMTVRTKGTDRGIRDRLKGGHRLGLNGVSGTAGGGGVGSPGVESGINYGAAQPGGVGSAGNAGSNESDPGIGSNFRVGGVNVDPVCFT